MSQTVTLSSESFVITCLLSLNTWNFRMLGAPVTEQNDNNYFTLPYNQKFFPTWFLFILVEQGLHELAVQY